MLAHRPARIVGALGGSATTDGGAVMLAALGVVFTDRLGRPFVPTGGTLGQIAEADPTGLVDPDGVELIAANDVTNPLLGPHGAAAVYGPQKGATPDDVEAIHALSAITEADSATDPELSAALLRQTGQHIARTLTPVPRTTDTADIL